MAGTGEQRGGRPRRPPAQDESPAPQRLRASKAARLALTQLGELIGKEPEGATSVQRGEHGWLVGVEVVEIRRVPATADILAVYEAELDENGELVGYRRTARYPRGQG